MDYSGSNNSPNDLEKYIEKVQKEMESQESVSWLFFNYLIFLNNIRSKEILKYYFFLQFCSSGRHSNAC